eukprot:Gb_03984 [translate_table: standard]
MCVADFGPCWISGKETSRRFRRKLLFSPGNDYENELATTNCSMEERCKVSYSYECSYNSQDTQHEVEHQPDYACSTLTDQMDKLGDKTKEQPKEGTEAENWDQLRARDFKPQDFGLDCVGLHPSSTHDHTIDGKTGGRRMFPLTNDYPGYKLDIFINPRKKKNSDSSLPNTTLGHTTDDRELESMTLRQWLTRPKRIVDRLECLHIFGQIIEAVDIAHSRGIILQNIRPSCFMLSSLNQNSCIDSKTSGTSSGIVSSERSMGRMSFFVQAKREKNICTVDFEGEVLKEGQQMDQCSSARKSGYDCHENKTSARSVFWQEIPPRNAIRRGSEAPERSTYSSLHTPRLDEGEMYKHVSSAVAMASSSHSISIGRRPNAEEEMGNVKLKDEYHEVNSQEKLECFQLNQTLLMELTWYTSPEELVGGSSSFSSDIYSLGVLFFELFCTFSSEVEQSRIMSDIRHRIPPPQLLLKWPKEVAFCLWLLHPEPHSRPKLCEVLRSEIVNEAREIIAEGKEVGKLEEEIADTELLLDFLIQVQQQKQETASKLYEAVSKLTSDIEVVLKQQSVLKQKGISSIELSKEEQSSLGKGKKSRHLSHQVEQTNGISLTESSSVANVLPLQTRQAFVPSKQFRQGCQNHSMSFGKKIGKSSFQGEMRGDLISRRERMLRNFKELEKGYFSTICRGKQLAGDSLGRYPGNSNLGQGSVLRTEGWNLKSVDSVSGIVQQNKRSKTDRLGSFFDSLCKHLRYSKFKVKATLRQGDLLNSSNLVCSLAFDRDKEYFATAGVSKKIKVFECKTVLNEDVDIHYPVIEMTSSSKLSSICWNSYIRNQIASSAFEGIVQLWDVTRSQPIVEFDEHEKRVWSVDFPQADPTRLASGSDDGSAKLWNINQGGSIGTIRTNANICCVQFSPDSARLLALGSADHKIYCYDLRNMKIPWCILTSHGKTVSYVKFLDSSTLVSASTDSMLKLWDLATNTGGVISNSVMTFTGHTNEKNFVGLSVADGYIATGSETNEVFVYHKSLPMPVASYKFNCVDPLTGEEIDDDGGQFVSSACWRGQSQTLVAANSTGNVKVLEMV